MENKKIFLSLVVTAIIIKLVIAFFTTSYAPDGKYEWDSKIYIRNAQALADHGVFARNQYKTGGFRYEDFRTPGYPAFLALFKKLHLSDNWVIFAQALLTVLAAFVTYKAAYLVDPRIAPLSTLIILYDPNITIQSNMIMTETVFLLVMSAVLLCFIKYIKSGNLKNLVFVGVLIAVSVYIRPIGYYLGGFIAVFILFLNIKNGFRKSVTHALVFVLVVYSLVGAWQVRNYKRFGKPYFSNITESVIPANSIYKSYTRNKDPYSQNLPPAAYYFNVTSRCFLSFMTRPGSFKYFNYKPLTVAGKIFSYPWIVFWVFGLLIGLMKINDKRLTLFLLTMILYFSAISILGGGWGIGSRFRIPIMPFVAIFASYGWCWIKILRKT